MMRIRLHGSGLRGPVTKLLSGSAFTFALGYGAKLILLRIYSPDEFGLFDFVVSIASVLLPVAGLRYEDAIMLPENDDEARDVLQLSGALTAGFCLVAAIPALFAAPVADLLGEPDVAPWLWTVSPILLVLRASKLGELWLTRRERFGRIAIGQVAQGTTQVSTRIAAGLAGAGTGGLLGGFMIGHFVAATLYVQAARDAFRLRPMDGLRKAAKRYVRFPTFSAPATLISALVTRLPFLLLLVFFDKTVLGWYGQAFNILYVPLSLIAVAIGQVFFVRAAAAAPGVELATLTESVHRRLVALALFPVVVTAVAGGDVFAVLFGETWRTAGGYTTWLGAWILFTAIASPLTRLFDVLERQRLDLLVHLAMLLAVSVALFWGGSTGSALTTIALVGSAGAVVRIAQTALLLAMAGVQVGAAVRPYFRHALLAGPAALVTWWIATVASPWGATASWAVFMTSYALYLAHREGYLVFKR